MKKRSAELLDSLRAAHTTTRRATSLSPIAHGSAPEPFDFATHPAFEQVRIAKAAGTTFGLPSPFFRQTDAVQGTRVRIGGRWVETFASYDYLGLNAADTLGTAVARGVADWGVSATASRLVGGERAYHRELETRLAGFLGAEASLTFVSGHATNVSLLRTLLGPGDLVAVDALAHNSVFEGIRASGAVHVSFPHNDWRWLDAHLADVRDRYRHVVIAVEGLYSMDGDTPDLARLVEVKDRHAAWLMVDEAHSLGVLGATGRGICEEQGVPQAAVEIRMGTLSKTLCSCGGFVAGSGGLIDLLRYVAPGFVYSVGLSAPDAHAAMAALRMAEDQPGRVRHLRMLGQRFCERARDAGLDTGPAEGFAVVPVMIGDSIKATWVSNALLEAGFNVLPIIAPAVPDKAARLRFFLTAGHDAACVDAAVDATASLVSRAKTMGLKELAGLPVQG